MALPSVPLPLPYAPTRTCLLILRLHKSSQLSWIDHAMCTFYDDRAVIFCFLFSGLTDLLGLISNLYAHLADKSIPVCVGSRGCVWSPIHTPVICSV